MLEWNDITIWVIIVCMVPASISAQPAMTQANQALDILQIKLKEVPDSTLRNLSSKVNEAWRSLVRRDLDSALLYAQKGVEIASALKDDSLLITAYRQMAANYSQSGDQKQARIYCNHMLPLIDQSNHLGFFRYYNMLGIVTFEEGNYEQALVHQMSALEAAKSGALTSHFSSVFSEISRIFDRMDQPLKALEFALKDQEQAKE